MIRSVELIYAAAAFRLCKYVANDKKKIDNNSVNNIFFCVFYIHSCIEYCLVIWHKKLFSFIHK